MGDSFWLEYPVAGLCPECAGDLLQKALCFLRINVVLRLSRSSLNDGVLRFERDYLIALVRSLAKKFLARNFRLTFVASVNHSKLELLALTDGHQIDAREIVTINDLQEIMFEKPQRSRTTRLFIKGSDADLEALFAVSASMLASNSVEPAVEPALELKIARVDF